MKKEQERCATCHYCYHHQRGFVCSNPESPYYQWIRSENDSCTEYSPSKSLEECIKQATPALSAAMEEEERCCGACAYMIGESPYGDGTCAKIFAETVYCGDKCYGDHFVSKDDMTKAVEVLEAHNLWQRDPNVPNSQPMQDPKELGKAIDFAVDYIKTFMGL